MSSALVAIGVSQAPPLDVLDGAVTDAKDLAAWAKKNGYAHVHALTDEDGSPVRAKAIFDTCERLLKIEDLDRLVIFFSGHGYSLLPGHEVWLLSDWNSDANEAINASTSLLLAKRFKRPQIAFIADACRQTWDDAQGTTGIVILPKPIPASDDSQVDEFYATAFGAISQQYQPAQRRASYGIFSKELLKGLRGAAAIKRDDRRLITSRSLEDHLKDVVPKAGAEIPDAAIQYPEAKAQWRLPKDVYAELAGPERPTRGPAKSASSPVVQRSLDERDRRINSDAQRYRAAEGRESYETVTGATVIGAEVRAVVASAGGVEHFEENGAWQIRVSGEVPGSTPREPCSLLVQIANEQWPGYWISIPAFPGLVATALIDANGFSSLNYRTATRYREQWLEPAACEIEAMLAEASAMFRYGVMPSRKRMREMIDRMRDFKLGNPALAIVAAHICYRLGDVAQIADMEDYEIGRGRYTPYDFLLLTGRDTPMPDREVVGHFPLLSPGWGLLAAAEFAVDDRLPQVVSGLAPSLWTMGNPAAGAILAEIVSDQRANAGVTWQQAAAAAELETEAEAVAIAIGIAEAKAEAKAEAATEAEAEAEADGE